MDLKLSKIKGTDLFIPPLLPAFAVVSSLPPSSLLGKLNKKIELYFAKC